MTAPSSVMRTLSKWIIPDKLRVMPFHRPAFGAIEYERLVMFMAHEMRRDKSNDGPVYLWMPERLNEWVWELWAWWRRRRGLPVTEE